MKGAGIFCILMMMFRGAGAQINTHAIKGMVVDSTTGKPLEQATVRLVKAEGLITLRQSLTARNGFLFRFVPQGSYKLVTSYIGYRTDTTRITLGANDTLYNSGLVRLRKAKTELMEVVVKTVIPPMIVKNDTLSYNANNYKTKSNATVADLIKKMPGIEVDKEGNITLQGQRVEKIYIDGREFFLNNAGRAVQSLPADLVAQVEAFDAQSERAKFLGIKETGNGKALNLKLKKDRKKIITGTAFGGHNGGGRYAGALQATRIAAGPWYSLRVYANNANDAVTNNGEARNGLGEGLRSRAGYDVDYDAGKSTNTKLLLGLEGSYNSNMQQRSSRRQTFLGDSVLFEKRYRTGTGINRSNGIDARLSCRLDSFNRIEFSPHWNSTRSSNHSMDTVALISNGKQLNSVGYTASMGQTEQAQATRGSNIINRVSFSHRFRKRGRNLVIGLLQGYDTRLTNGSLKNSLTVFNADSSLRNASRLDQQFTQRTGTGSYGTDISYTEPVRSGSVLDLHYNLDYNHNTSTKKSTSFNPLTGHYDLTDTLTTNDFSNSNTMHRVGVGYNVNRQQLSYQLGMATQFSRLENLNETKGTLLQQQVLNWFPRASMDYRIARGQTIRLAYDGKSVSATLEQLQPLPDLSNPFLVKIGNPALRQQFDHHVSLNYNRVNAATFSSLLFGLNLQGSMNKIVAATAIQPGGIQQMRYVNVDGVYSLGANIVYGFPLGNRKHGNGSFNTNVQYGHDLSFVNGAENIRTSIRLSQGLSLNYNYGDKLFVEFAANATYTHAGYSIQSGLDTDQFTELFNTDISYELPFDAAVSTNYSIRIAGAQAGLVGNSMMIWNAALSKNIFRNKTGEIRFSGIDLLRSNEGYTQNAGPNFIETTTSNTLNGLFLLSFMYHFNRAGI